MGMFVVQERRDSVQVITLNRPEKRNSLSPDLIGQLSLVLAEAEADAALRVVILTGAGSSFCAGLDLMHLAQLDSNERVDYMQSAFSLFRQLYELRQPTIAAVNGPAMAGGFDLAAFCDIRICSRSAQFAQTEILLGLTQIMYPVYKAIGLGRAKELALTGKPISAEYAEQIGLVSGVYPETTLMDAAGELASHIAARPSAAVEATKRLGRDLIEMDFDSAMTRMLEVIETRLLSEEHRVALADYVAGMTHRSVRE